MTYTKLYLISIFCIVGLAATLHTTTYDNPDDVTQHVHNWLYNHVISQPHQDLVFTEELLMKIKQDLFDHQHIKSMPHKDVKKIVKQQIISLQEKKFRSAQWFAKHKKELTQVIKQYFKKYPHNHWGIYQYLNASSNPVCKELQRTMKRTDVIPGDINQSIRMLINQLKPKGE